MGYLLAAAGVAIAPATARAGGDCFGGMFDSSYSDEYVAALMGWAAVVVPVAFRGVWSWRVSLLAAAAAAVAIWYHLAGSRAWLADWPLVASLGLATATALIRLVVVAVGRWSRERRVTTP